MRSQCFLVTKSLATFLDQASVCCSLHCRHWPSNQSGAKLYVPWLTFLNRRTAGDKMKSTDVDTPPRIKECIKINYTGLSQKMCHRNSWGGSVQWRMFTSLWVHRGNVYSRVFSVRKERQHAHTHTHTHTNTHTDINNNLFCEGATTFWVAPYVGQVDWH